ncbi:MAG: SRPBCC family protein [Alphaproteobacteria bacterium]|jgi:phenylpropionate dioxygenase-like ring-hydroxylating dioxygenase large terminal subunit
MSNKEKFNYKKGWKNNPEGKGLEKKTLYEDFGTERIDPERYHSKEFMDLEWEKVWTKTWLMACASSDIKSIGDYFNFNIGKESIIVMRSSEGTVSAFYNVCPHRGNKLLFEDFGFVKDIGCMFHGWKFNLDGTNKLVSDSETFREEVLCYDLDLSRIKVEEECGFVWVTLSDNPVSVREYLGEVADHLDLYEVENMNVIRHVQSEWGANWKTGLEAFYETYHLSFIHPQTQGMMEDYFVQLDTWNNGMNRMIVPFIEPSKRQEGHDLVNESTNIMLSDVGIDPIKFKGSAVEAKKAIQQKKREFSERFNLGYNRFTDAQLTDSFVYGIFPNIQIGCHPEGVFVHKFMPHPKDPEIFVYDTLINYRTVDDPNYHVPGWFGLPEGTNTSGKIRPDIVRYPLGVKPDLGEVLEQDSELIPFVQKGVRSKGFRGPLWSEQELRLRHFHNELNKWIG